MMLPVFRDLIKARWRVVLEALKEAGGMSVPELARRTGDSYMTVKSQCEELTKAGYLVRTRLPRVEVGRPEIHYSLGAKADALFPQAGMGFALELIGHLRKLYGENAPDRLLFLYFQDRTERWTKGLAHHATVTEKAVALAALREKEGFTCRCENEPGLPLRLIELHNPLQRLFEEFPRALTMELRMIEQLLGCRVTRGETPVGRETTPRVVFEIAGSRPAIG
jgi:predicted ArsR family transcriptional regulator